MHNYSLTELQARLQTLLVLLLLHKEKNKPEVMLMFCDSFVAFQGCYSDFFRQTLCIELVHNRATNCHHLLMSVL